MNLKGLRSFHPSPSTTTYRWISDRYYPFSVIYFQATEFFSQTAAYTQQKAGEGAKYTQKKAEEGADYTKRKADENASYTQEKAGEVKAKAEESKSNIWTFLSKL